MRRIFLALEFIVPFSIFAIIVLISIFFIYRPKYLNSFLSDEKISLDNIKYNIETQINSLKYNLSLIDAGIKYDDTETEITDYLNRVINLNSSFINVYYCNLLPIKSGGMFVNVPEPVPYDFDQTTREWFRVALVTNDSYISDPYVDVVSGKLAVAFAKASHDINGKIKGVIGIDFANMDGMFKDQIKNLEGTLNITTDKGYYIVHENKDYILNEKYNLFNSSIFSNLSKDNIDYSGKIIILDHNWMYLSKVDNANWLIAVHGNTKAFEDSFFKFMLMMFLVIFIFLVLEVLLVIRVVFPLSYSLNQAVFNIEKMSEGYFNASFSDEDLKKKGQTSQLIQKVDKMQKFINDLFSRIRNNVKDIDVSMQNISTENDNLFQRTSSQSSALEEVSASVKEFSSSVKDHSDGALNAKNMSYGAREATKVGVQSINEIVSNMNEISVSSHEISNITKTIQMIAFQTNILALNAAVEAARAGDQGKGFAVVASEIRSLAQSVDEAAKNITNIAEGAIARVNAGVESVTKSLDILKEIDTSINNVSNILSDLYDKSKDDEDIIMQINMAIEEIRIINDKNALFAESNSNSSLQVCEKTKSIVSDMEQFVF